jgi:hypothetical protein
MQTVSLKKTTICRKLIRNELFYTLIFLLLPVFLSDTLGIADGGVTTAKIADASVTSAKILDGTIAAIDLNSMGATKGQVLIFLIFLFFYQFINLRYLTRFGSTLPRRCRLFSSYSE